MADSETIPQQLADITVRLECKGAGGTTAVGTGFYYTFNESDDGAIPAIVTNRHVVESAVTAQIAIARADSNGEAIRGVNFNYTFNDFARVWVNLPTPGRQ